MGKMIGQATAISNAESEFMKWYASVKGTVEGTGADEAVDVSVKNCGTENYRYSG